MTTFRRMESKGVRGIDLNSSIRHEVNPSKNKNEQHYPSIFPTLKIPNLSENLPIYFHRLIVSTSPRRSLSQRSKFGADRCIRRGGGEGARMRRVFGAKKNKEPPPTIQEATDRISKRGEGVDEKIKKLDVELAKYKEQLKKTRPGPAQEALKARAMRVLKQKRMYEGQRDMIYNQTFNLDQVAFASEGLKDAQQTMSALKSANKDLKGMMKTVNLSEIDSMQDDMVDLMDESTEIQQSLGRSYGIPDDIDEDELLGELDALEADMGAEPESNAMPSYLQPEPDLDLPEAPMYTPQGRQQNIQLEDEFGLPPVPRSSVRN